MKDYCTSRPLVVRVQARMYIFWEIVIFYFLESNDDNNNDNDTTRKHLVSPLSRGRNTS